MPCIREHLQHVLRTQTVAIRRRNGRRRITILFDVSIEVELACLERSQAVEAHGFLRHGFCGLCHVFGCRHHHLIFNGTVLADGHATIIQHNARCVCTWIASGVASAQR